MFRVYLVLSFSLAILMLCSNLFEQNADLKELQGGECWVEVEHNCPGSRDCDYGPHPDADENYVCTSKLIRIRDIWTTATEATTTGNDFMFESTVYCWSKHACDKDEVGGKIYCITGNYVHDSGEHNNQDVDGEPCSVGG